MRWGRSWGKTSWLQAWMSCQLSEPAAATERHRHAVLRRFLLRKYLQQLACLWLGFCGRTSGAVRMSLDTNPTEALFIVAMYDIGLAPGALIRVDFTIASPNLTTVETDLSTGIVLLTQQQWNSWLEMAGAAWPRVLSDGILQWGRWWPKISQGHVSYYMSCAWRMPFRGGQANASTLIRGLGADRFYLGVINTRRSPLTLRGHVEYINPDEQQLQLQAVGLPQTLKAASLAFLLLMGVVYFLLAVVWTRGATLLHALLVACLWFKFIWLALRWSYWELLANEGESPQWREEVYKLVGNVESVLERLLLVLLGLGWRVLRARLTRTEAHITTLGILIFALLAVLEMILGSSGALYTIQLFSTMISIAAYMVIMVAANVNITLINLHISESLLTSGLPGLLYQKQRLYICFRRLFLVVVTRPIILHWLQYYALGDASCWLLEILEEGSQWTIYASLFAMLRPGGNVGRLSELIHILTQGRRRLLDGGSEGSSSTTLSSPATSSAAPLPQWSAGVFQGQSSIDEDLGYVSLGSGDSD